MSDINLLHDVKQIDSIIKQLEEIKNHIVSTQIVRKGRFNFLSKVPKDTDISVSKIVNSTPMEGSKTRKNASKGGKTRKNKK
jgi:hypothetical protein